MEKQLEKYLSVQAAEQALLQRFYDAMSQALQNSAQASIALCGGNTPRRLYQQISSLSLPWQRINITLTDERWVSPEDKRSNEKLLHDNLLINAASQANFIGLKSPHDSAFEAVQTICQRLQHLSDFDFVLLGMGSDGHTASLFPGTEQLAHGLQTVDDCLAVKITGQPVERMSLSAARLLHSKQTAIYITGDDKINTLRQSWQLKQRLTYPIYHFLEAANKLSIVWSPNEVEI